MALNSRQLVERRSQKLWIRDLKKDRGCVDCGYDANPVALQFDHIPGRGMKMFEVSTPPRNTTEEQLHREIEKCEVRCANCHAVKTQQRRLNS